MSFLIIYEFCQIETFIVITKREIITNKGNGREKGTSWLAYFKAEIFIVKIMSSKGCIPIMFLMYMQDSR